MLRNVRPILYIILKPLIDYYRFAHMYRYGQIADAKVINRSSFIVGLTRPVNLRIFYAFKIGIPGVDQREYHGVAIVDVSYFMSLGIGDHIEILYLPSNPHISLLPKNTLFTLRNKKKAPPRPQP